MQLRMADGKWIMAPCTCGIVHCDNEFVFSSDSDRIGNVEALPQLHPMNC